MFFATSHSKAVVEAIFFKFYNLLLSKDEYKTLIFGFDFKVEYYIN